MARVQSAVTPEHQQDVQPEVNKPLYTKLTLTDGATSNTPPPLFCLVYIKHMIRHK
jgi:hypothetical protein